MFLVCLLFARLSRGLGTAALSGPESSHCDGDESSEMASVGRRLVCTPCRKLASRRFYFLLDVLPSFLEAHTFGLEPTSEALYFSRSYFGLRFRNTRFGFGFGLRFQVGRGVALRSIFVIFAPFALARLIG